MVDSSVRGSTVSVLLLSSIIVVGLADIVSNTFVGMHLKHMKYYEKY